MYLEKWAGTILIWTHICLSRADDYSCDADTPCAIGCCSIYGVCGLGPTFCGSGNCTSTCDAKSDCDPGWGSEWSSAESCPLNVCCSEYGFCGTTSEFCGTNTVKEPSCDGSSATKRTVGYYEGWSIDRACDVMQPEDIPIGAYTHLNFAFAYINPTTFQVAPMAEDQVDLYNRTTALKALNDGMEVWISIGGWSMNDADQPTASTFSNLVGSSSAQESFFASLVSFMETYGFDGVDIDWEYPAATDRSGVAADYDNYVTFLQNLKTAMGASGHKYGLSITIPSSYWYMQHFDIVNIAKVVDWFNLMSYDLHGTWDSTDEYIGPYVYAHTNLTEIDESLQLLWRNDIDGSQINLGLGFYGRSFTLSDPSCTEPGCEFSGGGNAGNCTQNVGTLSYAEIQDVIAGGAVATLDSAAAVKQLVWDDNQWVSYDDAYTFGLKLDYANKHCLGGTMVWAVSLDTSDGKAAQALSTGTSDAAGTGQIDLSEDSVKTTYDASGQCFITDCAKSPTCPSGWGAVQQVNGNKQDVRITHGCGKGQKRTYCCPENDMPTCHWIGSATSCTGSCGDGEVALTYDTGGCITGHKTLCCKTTVSDQAIGDCVWKGTASLCSRDNTCPSDKPLLIAHSNTGDNQQPCDFDYKQSNLKSLCCTDPSPWTNCTWYTKGDQDPPPSNSRKCSGTCPSGKVLLATDNWCTWGGTRALCCDNPSTYNDNAMTDLKNRLTDFITPLSCPADEVDPLSSKKKRGIQARDYSLAGGMTLMNELAALQNARTYTAELGIQAFDTIYGLDYGLSYEALTNFTTYAMMGTDLTVGEAMVSALCEGKSAYQNLVDMQGAYGDLCVNPSLASNKRHFHQPDLIERGSPRQSHGVHHKHHYGQIIGHVETNEKRVFDPDTASTTGSTSTHGRPFTGALLDAIVNGNDEVTYLYSRRIDYRWRYTVNNRNYYVNQNILEVAFDITDSPSLQEHTNDIFAVFHFHVEEINGNYVGVRSFGVYHSQSVIAVGSTGDYRVYPGFNPNDGGTITIAAPNRRAHVLTCEDDNDDDWISREFLPGYTIAGSMPEGNYNIYEFGQWLYENNIVVPAAFPNYDSSTGFSYTRGHESANFRNDGGSVPDLSGYPRHSR